jgi:L-aspartate oxidase
MRREVDFLVIGAGVAGLFFALKAARKGRVLVITKAEKGESNTRYAQGGIAGVVSSDDSFEKHIQDTLIAGDGLCHEDIVRMVITEGPQRIQELMAFGAQFDTAADGTLLLGREGGHSENRILHSRDATGAEISRALIAAVEREPNIELVDDLFAVDLITQHHLGHYVNRGHPNITCYGVYALDLNTREMVTILSRVTVLASGGCGSVYEATTNPPIATGDGIAMALRAKARIANMEFIQFHPTALYETDMQPAFLITEALRGRGAILKNPYDLTPFMARYDSRADLAPRDIVARAIDQERKIAGYEYVYLDASHLPTEALKTEFPTIYQTLLEKGIDMTKEPIPVCPAAHYLCGGVQVDAFGQSSIQRLFAIGECSHTGLHGANRLASNSLLEAIVYGHRAAEAVLERVSDWGYQTDVPDWNDTGTVNTEEWVLVSYNRKEVQRLMNEYVGIVRSNLRLERAARRIALMYEETEAFYQRTKLSPELCELRNLIAVAYLIVKSARLRRESRGLHYSTDYPQHAGPIGDTLL